MRWGRTIQTVDVHCEGEIGRVITGGVLNIPGATMAEKLHHLNTVDDGLRRWLCLAKHSIAANHLRHHCHLTWLLFHGLATPLNRCLNGRGQSRWALLTRRCEPFR